MSANKKITELTALTSADNADVLPIVDTSASETKKITKENLLKEVNTKADAAQSDADAAQSDIDTHEARTDNPHATTKSQVGLGNVDNTSDANKPISSATQSALNAKADESDLTAHTGDKTNPHEVTKTQVGLSNVDNTSDADKPISDDTQDALDAKANDSDLTAHKNDTNNPHSVSKTQVGLGNVDNTADADKPVSTAVQNALDDKADLVDGKVPADQLPSYVDDVVEVANYAALPVTGEAGKIYVTLDDNKTYRWGGSAYVEISASLALGETSATAYRGDRGKTAYDHSQATGNPHGATGAQVNATPTTDVKRIDTVYDHPRNPTELDGNQTYSLGTSKGFAYRQLMASAVTFDRIITTIYDGAIEDITIKIFQRDADAGFDYTTQTPIHTQTIAGVSFPKSYVSGGNEIVLSAPVTIAQGKYLFIVFYPSSGGTSGTLTIRRWDTDPYSNDRQPFYFCNNNTTLVASSKPTYCQTSIRLRLNKNYNGLPIDLEHIVNNLPASGIKYDGANSGLAAENVQDAVDEMVENLPSLPVDAADVLATINVDYYLEQLGSELLVNPGFELGSGNAFTGWSVQGTIYEEKTLFHAGLRAMKMVKAAGAWYTEQAYEDKTVTPGQVYELSFYTRGDGTYDGVFAIYDNTHAAYIYGGSSQHTGVTGTTYQKVTHRFTAPAGCTSVKIWLFPSATTGAIVYYDDVSLKAVNNVNMNGVALPLSTILANFPAKNSKFDNVTAGMTSTDVQAAIKEAYDHAPAVDLIPRIHLPAEITAVVGDELQVFTRGIIEAMDPYALPYNFVSTVGSSFRRYFDFTPAVGDVGTKTLTVTIYDLERNVLATASTNLIVVNPTGQPASNKNVLCIGDSLTAGGVWPQEAYRRLTQAGGSPAGKSYSNIKFIGDVPMGSFATQGFVAWGGWTYGLHMGSSGSSANGYILTSTHDKDKTDVNSIYAYGSSTYRIMTVAGRLQLALYSGSDALPASGTLTWVSGGTHHSDIVYTAKASIPYGSVFYNPSNSRADFTDWFSRLGESGNIDVAYILLGWNELGTGPLATDHAAAITAAKAMIDRIHTDYPSCVIRLLGVEIPSYNGGLGTNYGANGGLSDYYLSIRNANGYNLAMKSIAAEAGYSSFVRYLGIHSQFDTENNMPQTTVAVNVRNSATEVRQTNGVHPDTTGYYQIADVVYRDFIRTFCS